MKQKKINYLFSSTHHHCKACGRGSLSSVVIVIVVVVYQNILRRSPLSIVRHRLVLSIWFCSSNSIHSAPSVHSRLSVFVHLHRLVVFFKSYVHSKYVSKIVFFKPYVHIFKDHIQVFKKLICTSTYCHINTYIYIFHINTYIYVIFVLIHTFT